VSSNTDFTFSKNMKFDTYATSLSNIDELFVGQDDGVYVFGIPSGQDENKLRKFNSTKKTFEQVSISSNENLSKIDVASDGAIWIADNGSVKKLSSTGSVQRTYSVSSGTIRNLSIGADETVYVVIGQTLYRLKPGSSAFTKFSNDDVSKVAAGRAGDLWIADSSNVVQQFTGTKFENRPLGQSVKAQDLGAGTDGSVYITFWDGNKYLLKKWNATNKSFDTVKDVNADMVDVDSDGRPWIANTSADKNVKRGKD